MQKQSQLFSLAKKLNRGLKHDVYDEESVKAIKMTRIIFNLPPLAIKLKYSEGRHMKLGLTEFPMFINALSRIHKRSL